MDKNVYDELDKIRVLCDRIKGICDEVLDNKDNKSLYDIVEEKVEEDEFFKRFNVGDYVYIQAVSRNLGISRYDAKKLCNLRCEKDIRKIYTIACPKCNRTVSGYNFSSMGEINWGDAAYCIDCDVEFFPDVTSVRECYVKVR